MTRFQMLSRTMGALGGAALLAIVALVACGGPVPIPGSSSLVGSGGSNGTHTDLGLTTSRVPRPTRGAGTRLPSGLPRATPTTHLWLLVAMRWVRKSQRPRSTPRPETSMELQPATAWLSSAWFAISRWEINPAGTRILRRRRPQTSQGSWPAPWAQTTSQFMQRHCGNRRGPPQARQLQPVVQQCSRSQYAVHIGVATRKRRRVASFQATQPTSFFPLDGAGFGNEGQNHNFSSPPRFTPPSSTVGERTSHSVEMTTCGSSSQAVGH